MSTINWLWVGLSYIQYKTDGSLSTKLSLFSGTKFPLNMSHICIMFLKVNGTNGETVCVKINWFIHLPIRFTSDAIHHLFYLTGNYFLTRSLQYLTDNIQSL